MRWKIKKQKRFIHCLRMKCEEEGDEYTDEFKAELDKINEYYENGGEMVSAEEVERQIHDIRQTEKLRRDI